MRLKLTEESVAALASEGRDRLFFDTLVSGFGIRLTPAGAKIFIAQARVQGKSRRLPVGRWPGTKVAVARGQAAEMLADMRNGNDPRGAKAIRLKELERSSTTVSDLADRWLREHVRLKRKPRTVTDYEAIIEQRVKPWAGHRSVESVTRADVMRLHADMASTPRRANYTVAVIKAMFSFAERIELRSSNPAKGIEMYREQPRERFLDRRELAAAAEMISKAEMTGKIGAHVAAGLRLCLFTGCRSGEATAIEWKHVDLKNKVVRLPDSKANRPRIIHLNGPAIETIKALPRTNGRFLVEGATPDEPAKNLRAAWIKIRKGGPLEGVRLHDLRHSFASAAVAKGLSLPMIGKLLGHTVPATTARYAHLEQDPVAAANALVAEVYEDASKTPPPRQTKIIPIRTRKTRQILTKPK